MSWARIANWLPADQLGSDVVTLSSHPPSLSQPWCRQFDTE